MNEKIDFQPTDEIEGETELTPPEIYLANLIEWAVDRHASDLFISDTQRSVLVAVRRLGSIEVVRHLARHYGHRLQGSLRVLAGADVGETIRPAEGRAVMDTPNGRTVDLRLSALPTLFGQDVAVRLFDPVIGARAIDQLGFDDRELEIVRRLLGRSSGLILLAGPVASGKSSTLYAMIDHLNDGTRKIHTLEDPIEHAINGVMQTEVNLRAGMDFADLLAVVLRHSPNVIMIGEIRDARTASTAVRAGASGQLVLATIHAKSSAEAIDSMLHYGTHPKFLSGALLGVVNQRLIRRLCKHCRQPAELHQPLSVPERLKTLMNGQQPTLYHASGCEECFQDGYDSLTSMPEIMEMHPDLTHAINRGIPSNELETMAQEAGMLTLAETAKLRAFTGVTTLQDVNQIVSDPELASLASNIKPVEENAADESSASAR